jgi:hypothetical protein
VGGVITGYFATADFDGDPATTADAGQNQCAGYFALDTTVSTSLADLSGSIPDDTNPQAWCTATSEEERPCRRPCSAPACPGRTPVAPRPR